MLTGLSPEAAALFAAAGPEAQDATIRRLVTPQFRWDHFLWLATRERVVPVIWPRFERLGLSIPAEVEETCRRQTMVAEFTAIRVEQRLRQTLDALREDGIEPVLLKGAALATTVYPRFRDRPMCDLDLLVLPDEGARGQQVALISGWLPVEAFEAADYTRHHHLPPLVDALGGVGLELHTDLFPQGSPFGALAEAMRLHSEPHPDGLGRVPTGAHEALHLCLHLAWSHIMLSGSWRAFRDLQCLQASGRVDWDAFRSEAEQMGATSCCYWVLRLARDLAGVSVPDNDLAGLRPPGTTVGHPVLARHFAAGLDMPGRQCPSLALQRSLWRYAIRPGRSGHGTRRPWTESVDVQNDPPMEVPGGPRPGKLGHLVETGRYLTGLITPF